MGASHVLGAGHASAGLLYGRLAREANMLSFNDAFLLLSGFDDRDAAPGLLHEKASMDGQARV